MRSALISNDFLLAPAYCEPGNIEYRVVNLIELSRSLAKMGRHPLLEIDATQRLIDRSKYPCEGLFVSNLAKAEDAIFSGKDIARIVNKILADGENYIYENNTLWEGDNISLAPPFSGIDAGRAAELEQMVESISINNELEDRDMSILHFCSSNDFPQVDFSATLTVVEPLPKMPLPHTFTRTLKLFSDYRQYLTSLTYQELVKNDPENVVLIGEAIYYEALRALKDRGEPLSRISRSDFGLGAEFIGSLRENQCLLDQKFSNTCFSCIVAVLTSDPSYEINMFARSDKPEQQRTHGDYRAFRAHVSKGGVGLRLMFWRRDDGYIELANVGPKHELRIANPSTAR